MCEGLDAPNERYEALFRLGSIGGGKAQFVVPKAVALLREQTAEQLRAGNEDDKRQDALLDFLIFLSKDRNRELLFEEARDKMSAWRRGEENWEIQEVEKEELGNMSLKGTLENQQGAGDEGGK